MRNPCPECDSDASVTTPDLKNFNIGFSTRLPVSQPTPRVLSWEGDQLRPHLHVVPPGASKGAPFFPAQEATRTSRGGLHFLVEGWEHLCHWCKEESLTLYTFANCRMNSANGRDRSDRVAVSDHEWRFPEPRDEAKLLTSCSCFT